MATESATFNYRGADDCIIENGIIKGKISPATRSTTLNYDSYGEMILDRLKANPKFVGQVNGMTGEKATFAEMMEKSVKCAIWLRRKINIMPGDVIGICTHNQMDMYIPCLASLYTGALYNAWWDVGLTLEIAKHFVKLTRPKVIFASRETASIAREACCSIVNDDESTGHCCKIIVFGKESFVMDHHQSSSLDEIIDESQEAKDVADFSCTKLSSLDEPAVILYTSGSTGLPKGVLYSNKSLFRNIDSFSNTNDVKNSVTLIYSPLSWLTGIYCMLKGITGTETRVVYPGEFTEDTCFRLIEKFKVNWMVLGSSGAFRIQKSGIMSSRYDVSSLKTLLVGGGPLKEQTQKALADCFPRATICQAYGSTEMARVVVKQALDHKADSCGRIVENIVMKIIDPDTGTVLNPNNIGEACFKHSNMMMGYYRNPEATREVIDSEGWLHTGDLMFYDQEGNVFFVDRLKEIIKYRGNHVSPTLIETLLQNHPGVYEVAVVSIPHDIDDEHPIAFVAKRPEIPITEQELEKMVADVLPDSMKLRGGVKFIDKLPHTSSDKISRSELKILAKSYAR